MSGAEHERATWDEYCAQRDKMISPVQAAFDQWRATGAEMTKDMSDAIDAVMAADTFLDRTQPGCDGARLPNRDAAFFVWQELAAGRFTAERLAFVQVVAQAVVAIEKAEREKSGALKGDRHKLLGTTLGLNYTADVYAPIRAVLNDEWNRRALLDREWYEALISRTGKERAKRDFRDLDNRTQLDVIERHRHLLPDPEKYEGHERHDVRKAIVKSVRHGKK